MDHLSKCCNCERPKAAHSCGICNQTVCRHCVKLTDDDLLSYLPKIPGHLLHATYCEKCYFDQVEPDLNNIKDLIEKAKDVTVFYKNDSKKTRLFDRTVKPISVSNCSDKDEALLKLAFLATLEGYNTIIDVDINFSKQRINHYQTSLWQGSAVPLKKNSLR